MRTWTNPYYVMAWAEFWLRLDLVSEVSKLRLEIMKLNNAAQLEKHSTPFSLSRKVSATGVCVGLACFGWFLYWISYDVAVWRKTLFQVDPVNLAGALVSLAVVLVGFIRKRLFRAR